MGICEYKSLNKKEKKDKKTEKISKNNNYQNNELIEQAIIINDKIIDISKEIRIKIIEQMENSICLIEDEEEQKKGTGFLCQIPFLNNEFHQQQFLITCYHVLNENKIKEGQEIRLTFKNNDIKIIKIDKERNKFTFKDLDVTIIEIKEEDDLSYFDFLEIDEKIKEENLKINYLEKNIYITHFPLGIFAQCNFGQIKKIKNNYLIYHNCHTEGGSSGSPILNLENNKVLGIHRGCDINQNLNVGLIFKGLLIKLGIIKAEDKIQNYLYLTLEITENNVNKEIYFLDNSFYDYTKDFKKYHSFLSELNNSNTKVYINDKKENKFTKCFRPTDKGLYTIRLEINIQMTDCRNMFEYCNNIKEIDLSDFDTSHVVDMSSMFKDCCRLEKLNLSYISTENVTNMKYMFYNCKNLNIINLSSFNTKNVRYMENIFSKCNKLEELNLSSFNTENVTNMKEMFSDCSDLTNLNIISFNTKNVKDMSGMFLNCNKLKTIKLPPSFITNKVETMKQMFCNCNCLKEVNLENFDTINVCDMSEMFSFCNSLGYLNLYSFDTRNVVNMRMMFNKCHDLFDLSINSNTFVNDNVKDMTKMFSGCHSLVNLKLPHFKYKDKIIDKIFEDTKFAWLENTSLLVWK